MIWHHAIYGNSTNEAPFHTMCLAALQSAMQAAMAAASMATGRLAPGGQRLSARGDSLHSQLLSGNLNPVSENSEVLENKQQPANSLQRERSTGSPFLNTGHVSDTEKLANHQTAVSQRRSMSANDYSNPGSSDAGQLHANGREQRPEVGNTFGTVMIIVC